MIYSLIVLTAGFFVLVKGADWFVDGASSLASIFHVSQLVIGLTICAMGTSLPEAAVSLVAGLKGNSGITICCFQVLFYLLWEKVNKLYRFKKDLF